MSNGEVSSHSSYEKLVDIIAEVERIVAADRKRDKAKADAMVDAKAKEELLNCKYFYRGESSLHSLPQAECPTLLDCSLDRKPKEYWKLERDLYHRAYQVNPNAFSHDVTMAERLTRMQHYSLPTRFADLSSSSLSAMFFACEDVRRKSDIKDGVVRIFKIHPRKMKRFTSDIIAAISHLPLLSPEQFRIGKSVVDDNSGLARLSYEVMKERPGFTIGDGFDKILWREIQQVWAFDPIWNNERIRNQEGILLAYGCRDKKEPLHPSFSEADFEVPTDDQFDPGKPSCGICQVDYVKIHKDAKQNILEELRTYGILEELIYPDLSNACDAIAKRMGAKRDDHGRVSGYTLGMQYEECGEARDDADLQPSTNEDDSFWTGFYKYCRSKNATIGQEPDSDSSYFNLDIKSKNKSYSLHFSATWKKRITLMIYINGESNRGRLREKKEDICKYLPIDIRQSSDWVDSKYPENDGFKRIVFRWVEYYEDPRTDRDVAYRKMFQTLCQLIAGLENAGEELDGVESLRDEIDNAKKLNEQQGVNKL